MDQLQRSFYSREFRIAFLSKKGSAFQALFDDIMGHAHVGNFQKVRPYGNRGDLKCDGYLKSNGTVFQCYGPDVIKLSELLSKMDKDFLGAITHWGSKMKTWTFVHNDERGLPADAIQKLADFESSYPAINIDTVSYAELFHLVMELDIIKLEDLFGYSPNFGALVALDFAALKPVITSIQKRQPYLDAPVRAPSESKISANALSSDAAELLVHGRRREELVEDFFAKWPNPDLGDQIAEGFRNHYQALKAVALSPDEIFAELQIFAGGMNGEPARQSAVLAVMSYYFERCDIFEDVESGI